MISNVYETKLWHRKLGLLNIKSMRKIVSEKDIIGLPDLKIEEGKIYGECPIEKQTNMPQKKV